MSLRNLRIRMDGAAGCVEVVLLALVVSTFLGAAKKLVYVPANVASGTAFNLLASTGPQRENDRRRYEIPTTPKFAADNQDGVLNVHVVPHTHDDVGFIKTLHQYFYGLNNTIHNHRPDGAVKYALSSIVHALVDNPNRTFTWVEQKFFHMWWLEQTVATRKTVKELIRNGQWTFTNGGWCMHDEATTHYMGMIDQTTLGHDFLLKEFGVIPTVGWQLDPFGHSSTQASLMTREMGFNALYFGRIDKQDMAIRHEIQECEGLWDASSSLEDTTTFWGLTGEYENIYGWFFDFCFDVQCPDDPIVGQNEHVRLERTKQFVNNLKRQSDRTKGNHVMYTAGADFEYVEATFNFANMDLLMHSILNYQASGEIDIANIFGPRFERLAIFYSTPEYYTEQKYAETTRQMEPTSWKTKNDDFFPYSDCDHCYWTGYFTTRSGLKRLERVASSYLLAARQIESIDALMNDRNHRHPLYHLEDSVSVVQHHDSITGTSKQHVANDYARRVQRGIDSTNSFIVKKLRHLLLEEDAVDEYLQDLTLCQLLNETICDLSMAQTENGDFDLYVVIYNGLARGRSSVVAIPVYGGRNYIVERLGAGGKDPEEINVPYWKKDVACEDKAILYFLDNGDMPVGATTYKISPDRPSKEEKKGMRGLREGQDACKEVEGHFSNEIFSVQFDCETGMMKKIENTEGGSTLSIKQEWGYYTSFDTGTNSKSPDGLEQNSGAYIFRPKTPKEQLTATIPVPNRASFQTSDVGVEVKTFFEGSWIEQTTRLFHGQPFVEIEYKIGPVPIDDGVGKEVVTRFSTPIHSEGRFYTDSNGREFQKRTRSYRPTWNLTEYEPVAGNYYPVNAAMYIEDESASLAVLVDRSQGGASLFDGSVELMVQRRTLRDDNRGVGEPLNETTGGVTPYPPYGDATRVGEGVIIIGKHRLMVGKGNQAASLARSQMDGAIAEPVVFVASAAKGTTVPFRQKSFSGLQQSLPPNVMLLTFKLLSHLEPPFLSFRIRLGHQYAIGEDATLSKPAEVDVGQLLDGYEVHSLVEKTLSGNRDYADWVKNRFNWTGPSTGSRQRRRDRHLEDNGFVVSLHPMEIRTFEVRARAQRYV